jgi:hypothetical protein
MAAVRGVRSAWLKRRGIEFDKMDCANVTGEILDGLTSRVDDSTSERNEELLFPLDALRYPNRNPGGRRMEDDF